MSTLRIAVDAVIIDAAKILLIEYEDARFGHHFSLPGGGVEPGERLHDALRREVREETGTDVLVGELLLVNEYVPADHASCYSTDHELRLIFRCNLVDGTEQKSPTQPDPDQLGVQWVPLAELASIRFLPQIGQRLLDLLALAGQVDRFNTLF